MGRSYQVMEPLRARSMPEMVLIIVDFPAPLEPMTVTISPSATSREIPRRACKSP